MQFVLVQTPYLFLLIRTSLIALLAF